MTDRHRTASRTAGRRHLSAVALVLALVGAIVLVGATSSARADSSDTVVLDWNAHALAALGAAGFPAEPAATPPLAAVAGAGQTPPVMGLHMAMVQGAVYDAVNSIVGGHESYLDVDPAPSTASETAAAATAAHDVLVAILGQQPNLDEGALVARLGILLARSIAGADDGVVSQGVTAGEAAADAMIAARITNPDGRYPATPPSPPVFVPGSEPGQWRPVTGSTVDPFAWVARVEPFAIEDATKFISTGPPALTSGQYAKEYDEVKSVGSTNNNEVLSAEQEAVRDFYTSAANPVEMFNRSLRGYVAGAGLGVAEQARFFALLGLSGADTFITCWEDKSTWSFWRPQTAIQLGESDGNPKTAGEPGWTSWAANPPYPDQSSGYNCATASLMYAAESFLGQGRTEFTVVRTPGVARPYDHFRDVVQDTIDARIYQGLHFRTADEAGAKIGRDVARAIAAHELR